MTRGRLLLAAITGLLLAGAGLLAFAGIALHTPLQPVRVLELDPARLASADARIDRRGPLPKIIGAPANGITLIMHEVEPFEARDFRHFTLKLAEVPLVLRGMMSWRTNDGKIHAIPLPGMFLAGSTLDLGRFEEWQGTVDAIGFGILPSDYIAAELTRQRSLLFVHGRLASESWGGSLRALISQWTAYRPWNGRSNHTSGFELTSVPGPSLQAFVFSLLVIALLCAFVAGGRAALGRLGVIVICVALSALALRQVMQLGLRAQVAVESSARAAVRPEWPLAAMPQLAHEARLLEQQLTAMAPPRILVWGEGGFMREYPAWLLRRFNVASLRRPASIEPLSKALDGNVLVLAGAGDWTYDAEASVLQLGATRLSVTPIMQGSMLTAYRLQEPMP